MVRIIRRRLLPAVACLILVPAIAVGYSLSQPKEYAATASLLFRNDTGVDQQLFGGNATQSQPSTDPTREAATNLELASLTTIAYQTATRFKHGLTGDDVAGKVKATPVGQSNVVSIVARDSDPALAADLANAFARQFIAFRRAADQSKLLETQQLVERELARLSRGQRDGPRGRQLATRADELRILASLQTGNAELVQSARVPTSPASPRPRAALRLNPREPSILELADGLKGRGPGEWHTRAPAIARKALLDGRLTITGS